MNRQKWIKCHQRWIVVSVQIHHPDFQGQVCCHAPINVGSRQQAADSRQPPTTDLFEPNKQGLPCLQKALFQGSHTQWLQEIGIYKPSHSCLLQDTLRSRKPHHVSHIIDTPALQFNFFLYPTLFCPPSLHRCWYLINILQIASHCMYLENPMCIQCAYRPAAFLFSSPINYFSQFSLCVNVAQKTTKTNLEKIVLGGSFPLLHNIYYFVCYLVKITQNLTIHYDL